jgi:NADP-dependent 3-hydroxy acid dehydrogenase YdfG
MVEAMKTAVVTGASAGIGEATARALAAAGFRVVLGARRLARVSEIAAEINAASAGRLPGGAAGGMPEAVALALDVADAASVAAFADRLTQGPPVQLLVNNAGMAYGLDPVSQASDDDWRTMWEINVLGVMRMTRSLLPALLASGDGHIVNIGSVAGFETYVGGAGYTGTKHALRALTRTLRLELVGQPVRITEIDPGMVETEFSRVRFRGDEERARSVYRGMQPLTGDDVAACVVFAATRPAHVNIDEMVVRPLDQATAQIVHRRG